MSAESALSPGGAPLRVVLCWHMHQPQYRDLLTGDYLLPWTYLHAIKDYTDMAAHLEAVPGARAVVNFSPILLEQLQDYSANLRAFLEVGTPLRDPLLAALAADRAPAGEARVAVIHASIRANRQRLIERFPAYLRLLPLAECVLAAPDSADLVSDQLVFDLLTWYHLAWLGETVRREDPRARRLIGRASGYTQADRRELLGLIEELVSAVIPRYRALAETGRVELSVTPYAHPILPLLLDLESAREAMPEVALPLASVYPGGERRAHWHLERAMAAFEQAFGHPPRGCWPSEGSVSLATLQMLSGYGFRWAASGESVLFNSLRAGDQADQPREQALYGPKIVKGTRTRCFFRDDGLSDLIGFTYSDWHADDAVANLISHLERIAASDHTAEDAVVSIILDGENAWEYYPENAYYFLRALYERLAAHPGIELLTFSEALQGREAGDELNTLVAGSWVYGSFSTWIGDADKNRGWDVLVAAKQAYDEVTAGTEPEAELLEQLAVCEGSDWFWWFGDYNPSGTVRDFDRLYRTHLGNLYRLLGRPLPESLQHSLSEGGDVTLEAGGTMRHGQAQG